MVSVNLNNNNHTPLEFCILLEQSLKKDSDELEEIHMEAAIDAGFAELDIDNDTDNDNNNENKSTINKNSVQNCLSPYVPTNAQKIISFFEFVGLLPSDKVISNKDNPTTTAEGNVPPEIDTRQQHCINQNDILLDIGCGDGRICIAASQLNLVKKAIGIDISPPCITMAKSTQQLYNIDTNQCIFYRYDITKFLVHIINDQNIHKDQNKQQQQSIIKSSIDGMYFEDLFRTICRRRQKKGMNVIYLTIHLFFHSFVLFVV